MAKEPHVFMVKKDEELEIIISYIKDKKTKIMTMIFKNGVWRVVKK